MRSGLICSPFSRGTAISSMVASTGEAICTRSLFCTTAFATTIGSDVGATTPTLTAAAAGYSESPTLRPASMTVAGLADPGSPGSDAGLQAVKGTTAPPSAAAATQRRTRIMVRLPRTGREAGF